MSATHWIGVDLGGTKVLAGVFDEHFQLLAREKEPTEAERGPAAVFNQVRKAVETALDKAGVAPQQVRGLGMGVPGQVEPDTRLVRYAPNLNWRNLKLPDHVPPDWTWPCCFENDVKVGTYGEYTHGAARGARSVLGIFVGTGVGGGLVLNGLIYNGFNFCAGEIGHTIVHWRKGTDLETLAGRRSLMKRAAELLADAPRHVRKAWKGVDMDGVKSSFLAERYAEGDQLIVPLIDDAARALGAAVGSAVNFLSPEVIVIGGGMAGALGDSFLERVWEIALRYALPGAADGVRCVPAALEDNSGIYGAAAYARDYCARSSAAPR